MSLGLLGFLRELVMDSGVPIHIIDTAGGLVLGSNTGFCWFK